MAAVTPSFADSEWMIISGVDIPADIPAHGLEHVSSGNFQAVFDSPSARSLLGTDVQDTTHPDIEYLYRTYDYAGYIERRIADIPPRPLLSIGVAALWSFIQANVTGPPLPFAPEHFLLPSSLAADNAFMAALAKSTINALSVDGESAYHLTPKVILLLLSRCVLNSSTLVEAGLETARWWRMRVNFMHQKILSEATAALHDLIYADIAGLLTVIESRTPDVKARFLVEKALVDTYFGHDTTALQGLEAAAATTGLQYALTGVLGKRTKFQQTDTSQLVVIAQSAAPSSTTSLTAPKKLALNDDTLLESIAFTPRSITVIDDTSALSTTLASLDPGSQPKLQPLDAAILLLVAETIKNTNPAEGLTREEMMPYAERVLRHPTNWEVYTLGLLVRSKIEGYRSRTVERGLLQLQAVVDQVIADTSSSTTGTTTFLPRANDDAAPIKDRLLYIHQLSVPTRWDLEAELASRWISLGGLRTALEIYERLEMWAEAALCWAATGKEDKARKILLNQLFHPGPTGTRSEIAPPPPLASRLWCILGDLEANPAHYERAWEVSGGRYARAKRSLGRFYFSSGNHQQAADAYSASQAVNPLNGPSWFALGCCWLELEDWEGAVEAFTRSVSIDETDAEAWSNLATALLRRETTLPAQSEWHSSEDFEIRDENKLGNARLVAKEANKRNALTALKRASAAKHDSWRIWENLLVIAASVNPPSYMDVVVAMKRVVELRRDTAGETCVDVDILSLLIRHIITYDLEGDAAGYDPSKPGLPKMVVELVEKDIVPLITNDARLWRLVAKIALWRKRPRDALEAEEKAWRAVSSRPGVADDSWEELVDATVEMVGAYESLGEMEREGLGACVVAKDWRFKARTCVRGVIGRGRESWEGGEEWQRLVDTLEGLKV